MQPTSPNTVGDIIRQVRIEKGLTLKDLATKLSTTKQTISRWENGKYRIRIDALLQIADILGIPAAQLLPDTKEENIPAIKTPPVTHTNNLSIKGFFITQIPSIRHFIELDGIQYSLDVVYKILQELANGGIISVHDDLTDFLRDHNYAEYLSGPQRYLVVTERTNEKFHMFWDAIRKYRITLRGTAL